MIYFLAKYVEMKQKKMRVETGRKCPTQYISVLQVVAIEGKMERFASFELYSPINNNCERWKWICEEIERILLLCAHNLGESK